MTLVNDILIQLKTAKPRPNEQIYELQQQVLMVMAENENLKR